MITYYPERTLEQTQPTRKSKTFCVSCKGKDMIKKDFLKKCGNWPMLEMIEAQHPEESNGN